MDKLNTCDFIEIVKTMSRVIIQNEIYFCELDSPAGDGDFGMSLAKGFKQLEKEFDNLSKESIGEFLYQAGMVISEHCGGASGPIWGSAFRGAGKYSKELQQVDLVQISELMQSAVQAIQKTGGAKLGDKTLIDALVPAVNTLDECAKSNVSIPDAFRKSAKAAVQGAEKTKEMIASRGRATYLGERSIGHPDAGAMAIGILFTEISEIIFLSEENN